MTESVSLLEIKLKHLKVNGKPYFSCDLGYLSINFPPRIEVDEDGPRVVCIDVDADALIMNDADRPELYRLYEENEFLIQTFFQVVVLQQVDYPYPKSIFKKMLTLDLSEQERGIVNQHISGFTFIYFIRDLDTGLTKIGKSDNPERRLSQLIKQATLLPKPNNFKILRAWEDYPYIEKALHQQFAAKRIRGEWFDLTDEDLDYAVKLSNDDPQC